MQSRPVGQHIPCAPKPVNPLPRKYSTLPKFGFAVISRHPDPRRGAIVRRVERGSGCGGRGSARHGYAGPGRDEPREVFAPCRRTALCPAKLLKPSRASCVRRKRVVLTVVATVKPCGDGSRLNRASRHRQFAR
ncbi:hypothetical protein WN72_04350 [Bradyrhizobium arachidis]|uniref:Uncharacterized protein n=1 Tax=Bradyrhizobium arachidis TaxID=858423 RepID=A0AAE7NLW7_9BRAD|nr:hypothetical protein WN72_04350 [Bradyrhizobium arachidis]